LSNDKRNERPNPYMSDSHEYGNTVCADFGLRVNDDTVSGASMCFVTIDHVDSSNPFGMYNGFYVVGGVAKLSLSHSPQYMNISRGLYG